MGNTCYLGTVSHPGFSTRMEITSNVTCGAQLSLYVLYLLCIYLLDIYIIYQTMGKNIREFKGKLTQYKITHRYYWTQQTQQQTITCAGNVRPLSPRLHLLSQIHNISSFCNHGRSRTILQMWKIPKPPELRVD